MVLHTKCRSRKGTLVYVNYTAKVKDTGEAIETTIEEEAKKLDIYDADRRYEPRLVAVGEDWVLKGLDEEIAKMDVGEKKTAELPPDRAWGGQGPDAPEDGAAPQVRREGGRAAGRGRGGDGQPRRGRPVHRVREGPGGLQPQAGGQDPGLRHRGGEEGRAGRGHDPLAHQEAVPGRGREDRVHPERGRRLGHDPGRGFPGRGAPVHQEGHRERRAPLRPRGEEGHVHGGLPAQGRGGQGEGARPRQKRRAAAQKPQRRRKKRSRRPSGAKSRRSSWRARPRSSCRASPSRVSCSGRALSRAPRRAPSLSRRPRSRAPPPRSAR